MFCRVVEQPSSYVSLQTQTYFVIICYSDDRKEDYIQDSRSSNVYDELGSKLYLIHCTKHIPTQNKWLVVLFDNNVPAQNTLLLFLFLNVRKIVNQVYVSAFVLVLV